MFKDGGKEEKKKDPTSSSVKCFFIRKESIEMVYEARSLFMHAHRLPSVANYMARYVDNPKSLLRAISKNFS